MTKIAESYGKSGCILIINWSGGLSLAPIQIQIYLVHLQEFMSITRFLCAEIIRI